MKLAVIVGSIVAAYDNGGADGGAGKEHYHRVDDACCGSHSGQSLRADKISDDKTVNRVVKLLE